MSPPVADGNIAAPARLTVPAPTFDLLDDESGFSLPRAIFVAALLSVPFWALFAFALYLVL
jgi:hypothetical protein